MIGLGMGFGLGKASGSASDGLSLDLQFAADKTLTARKGPTPTFLRASAATQVNAAGLIEYAPENLLLKSEEFNDVYWTTTRASIATNATTSPDGTNTAEKLIADTSIANNHRVDRTSVVLSLNTVHTFSVYAKASEYSGLAIGVHPSFTDGVRFSLVGSGTVTSAPPGYTGTIQSLADGWYRCTATFTSDAATAANRVLIYAGQNGTTFLYTGNGTSGIFLWGAQLERSSTARAYIPTTTAAVYGARFDHDPLTLACKGLLIEEQRINSQRDSADFSLWTNGIGTTTTTNQATSPDGTSTADVFAETTANTQHFISDTLNVSVTSGTAYTLSVFAKKGIGSTAPDLVQITGSGGAFGTTQYATFNIQNGSVNSSAGGAATIQSFGNGWYRLSFTVSATATTTTALLISFVGLAPASRLPSYIGLVTSDMYLWGAQLEAGAFATSYIPTTTGPVTRSADTCSITGSDFTSFYNQAEGTMSGQGSAGGVSATLIMANSGANANQVSIYRASTNVTFGVAVSGIYSATITQAFAQGEIFKFAGSYATNDARAAFNGTLATPDVSVIVPNNLTRFNIGAAGAANTEFLNGHIASIKYFRKRLPNAKLQTLST